MGWQQQRRRRRSASAWADISFTEWREKLFHSSGVCGSWFKALFSLFFLMWWNKSYPEISSGRSPTAPLAPSFTLDNSTNFRLVAQPMATNPKLVSPAFSFPFWVSGVSFEQQQTKQKTAAQSLNLDFCCVVSHSAIRQPLSVKLWFTHKTKKQSF